MAEWVWNAIWGAAAVVAYLFGYNRGYRDGYRTDRTCPDCVAWHESRRHLMRHLTKGRDRRG